MRRSPAREGFIERGHFFDAAAAMWVAGELVHIEDLVLHDARMDVRTPTHELTIAHAQLRTRRRIAASEPDWSLSAVGMAALSGVAPEQTGSRTVDGQGEGRSDIDEDDPLSREFANIDAILERSRRLIDGMVVGTSAEPVAKKALVVGELMIRDPEWDEEDRLSQWRQVMKKVVDFPPALSAAVLYDAWEHLEPMQHQHWLDAQLVDAYLRARGKVASHLCAFNVGLKAVPRERRRAHGRSTRLIAFLDAMTGSAETGMKEISRLSQAREQMERHLRGRRSSSSLPAAIELVLSRPIVSSAMIAKVAGVTPRAALTLVSELRVRELTGRGRYRAWGVL